MNDPAKGGSEYLQQKVAFARDALAKPVAAPAEEKPAEGGAEGGGDSKTGK